MIPILFLKGILIGFVMAVPIGPTGAICIRKTLSEGWLRGIIVGLGAATADFLYGCVAAFGITIVSNFLNDYKNEIRIASGVLLLGVGILVYNSQLRNTGILSANHNPLKLYLSTALFTLSNPFTVFAVIAIFSLLGPDSTKSISNGLPLVTGVFAGSALWFILLSYMVSVFKNRLNSKGLLITNRIAGVFIFISGAISLLSLL